MVVTVATMHSSYAVVEIDSTHSSRSVKVHFLFLLKSLASHYPLLVAGVGQHEP